MIAAVIGLVIAFCCAYVLTYAKTPLKKAIDMTTLVAMAVPGIVLGVGYIFVWNQKWLVPIGLHLYGTPAILVLAVVAAAIPLINRILVAGMAKIPESLLIAAEMQGSGILYKDQNNPSAPPAQQLCVSGVVRVWRKHLQSCHHDNFVSAQLGDAAGVDLRLV